MPGAFDIFFQLMPAADQDGRQLFTFGFAQAKGVAGFQKTLNQWVKCFLTSKGRDPSDKTYGTNFNALIGSNVSGFRDFTDAITLAIDDCTEQIKSFQKNAKVTDDERLNSVQLLRIEPRANDGYAVFILLTNSLQQASAVVLPNFAAAA